MHSFLNAVKRRPLRGAAVDVNFPDNGGRNDGQRAADEGDRLQPKNHDSITTVNRFHLAKQENGNARTARLIMIRFRAVVVLCWHAVLMARS